MINEKGEEVGIIYGWYNTKNEKWYIGQTIHPEARFKSHIYFATRIKNSNHFYRAIRKYGLENFVYCVLEENVLFENLNMREMDWIEYYDSFYSGYNLTLGGDGAKGVILSEEARRKISEFHKGKPAWNSGKHGIYSEETLNKLSKAFKGRKPWNKGIPMTEEQKIKISESKINPSKETRIKLSESHKGQKAWNKGIPMTEEAKNKLSESLKGKISSKRKPVSKYDLNGNFIETYQSIAEAIKENYKCSGICQVCRGISKTAGGFIWKYA